METNLSNKYLAYVIDRTTRKLLIKMFPRLHQKHICDHITLEYDNVTPELVERFNKKKMECVAIQYLSNVGVECLVVSVDGLVVRPDNNFYHITLSVAEGHSAIESNLLLHSARIADEFKILITGNIKLIDK